MHEGMKAKGVLTLSRNFEVMSADPGLEALLGCKPAVGERWPLSRFFAPQSLEGAQEAVKEAFGCGRTFENQQAMLLCTGGTRLQCRYHLQPLTNSESRTIGLIFTLKTAPHRLSTMPQGVNPSRAEEMPQETPATLFEHLPEGSFTIDAQWRIRSFNQAAERITGFSREETIGRHCWEIFRSDSCHKQCPMRQALDRQQPEMDRQVFAVNRCGQGQTLSVNISLLKDARGGIVGAIETFHPAGGDRPSPFGVPGRFEGIIGNSPPMRALFAQLPDLAASRANVLIGGESGTGKELIARTLHALSPHKSAPFVAVNCAALAETLIEAELFGHERGAFTGAEHSRPGRFEAAGQGTLLLDEIGELKADLQSKLLRVIEQRSFERVGGTKPVAFKARLISATHQDLVQAIQAKRFREDLFYRLRTVTLTIPPLRRRPEDIPLLVDHFIKKFNAKTGKKVHSLDPKVMQRFMAYRWPGNVRELERCIEHAFVFVKGPVIFQRYLPDLEDFDESTTLPLSSQLNPDDRESVLWALKQTGGRREAASRLLGISRTSVWRRMKAMGLE